MAPQKRKKRVLKPSDEAVGASPYTISKAELARFMGLSRARITQLAQAGMPVLPDGRVNLKACLAWADRTLDPAKRAAASGAGFVTVDPEDRRLFQESRALRTEYEARLTELRARVKEGELADADEVRRRTFERFRRLRDALLTIPDRTAAAVASMRSPEDVAGLLRDEIARVFREAGGGGGG